MLPSCRHRQLALSVRKRRELQNNYYHGGEKKMIVEAMENFARLNGPWLQALNDVNAAAVASNRIAFGQLELAAITSRFMTQRIRAYADYDGRIEPLMRRLDQLTEQYGQDYARELRQIYSAWSDVLREDRAATQAMPMPGPLGAGRRDQAWNGMGDDRARGDEAAGSEAHATGAAHRGEERAGGAEPNRDEGAKGEERGKKRSDRRPENPAH
jgi:hypothetical protein